MTAYNLTSLVNRKGDLAPVNARDLFAMQPLNKTR